MSHWKRSRYVYLALDDEEVYDLSALLRGKLEKQYRSRLSALVLLRGERVEVTLEQVRILLELPSSSWVSSQEFLERHGPDRESMEELLRMGLVVTDLEDPEANRARRFDDTFAEFHWHPDAVMFHSMSRLGEGEAVDIKDVSANADALANDFVKRFGPPPSAFLDLKKGSPSLPLPQEAEHRPFHDILEARRTVRVFDTSRSLKLSTMSTLLKYTFGVFGEARLGPDVQLLHKTSPSGGSLHPIEAFPLVIDVDGLEPGYYHYDIRDHGLVPLVTMATKEDARQVAREISTQQLYVGDAPLVVVMVARFSRNQWKYRHQSRTYSVMMMDAGHLSQTFYLTATDLGLGAFYSGAIDSVKIEDALDLEPAELGAIGICGCGFSVDPEGESSDGGLPFVPVS